MNRQHHPLLMLILWLALTPWNLQAHPHDAATINMAFKVNEKDLECLLSLSRAVVLQMLGVVRDLETGKVNTENLDEDALSMFLSYDLQVKIDGILVPSVMKECYYEDTFGQRGEAMTGGDPWIMQVRLSYPLPAAPRNISVAINRQMLFKNMDTYNGVALKEHAEESGIPLKELEAQLAPVTGQFVAGAKSVGFYLTADERGFTWHAPREAKASSIIKVQTDPTPSNPMPMILATVGLFAFVLLLVRRKPEGGLRPVLLGALLLATVGIGAYGLIKTGTSGLPEPDEALDVFSKLHLNIYRSFEYNNESDIYDSLSQSVSGPILDEIYQDVYRGLILADEGGAVCTVDKVEVLSSKFVPPTQGDEKLAFQVECDWKVHGMVTHWGHSHKRVNRYSAQYTVSSVDQAWKITDSQVKEQQRVTE